MQNIRLISYDNPNDYFDIPWTWTSLPSPSLDDLEAEANRGKLTAYLYRVRAGEVPSIKIPIIKRLSQKQLKPLFRIVRPVHLYLSYFEKYDDCFKQIEVYVKKPNPPYYRVPEDNNTDNIIYQPFDLEIASYESIS